ncbi:MAG: Asp-tRNA(Asn)/Glu-tRNA(Gln) amidotransferase subunit GatC [Rhodothermales bacterium]|nr:Asp-tRNA(Asn)/Glu-tRNA(Gln) amidotransferase subunit GatC [Rhodothermales bacterium]MBO6779591.1 Asp-tRNA(Asn)/Glu-tRNA(Gln) amidotransferase subunit GatC [Rhodothermales bacterium]
MSVSIEDVRYVARLARLSFSPEEEEAMARDLSRVLDYMQKLNELDTTDVPPMAHVLDRVDVFRADRQESRISHQDALKNAPDHDGSHFRVPKVI